MPNTIAENLQRLVDARTDIASSIITKEGTVGTGDGFEEFPEDILTIPSCGGGAGGSDVIFYDYDGTVVASYSAADFANLSAMPANPTHTGLTAQGWNWTLADAKTYVAKYGSLNIGQMYTTSDGKTRFYFTVTKDSLSVELNLELGSDTELDIDWGDESEHTTWTSADGDSSKSHEYASAGRYIIAITVATGEFYFSPVPLVNIYKLEIGNGVTSIDGTVFYDCSSLSSITIPDSVTSIDYEAFNSCRALSSITIPDSVTSIGDSTFYNCTSLSSITIPDSVTSIGDGAFNGCNALSSITIPDSVTSIGHDAFNSCRALSSITIPDSVTSISRGTFGSCTSLSSITIPDSVTSIGDAAFYGSYALSSITIPDSVTSIGDGAFNGGGSVSVITFESSTPPNLASSFEISADCIIRVPQGSLSAYTSASNYPDPSEYIYEEY